MDLHNSYLLKQPFALIIVIWYAFFSPFKKKKRKDFQGSSSLTIKNTNLALIFGIYNEPMTGGQCNIVLERVGDYLYDQGFWIKNWNF